MNSTMHLNDWNRRVPDRLGFCGNLIRSILFTVNLLFCVLGLCIFITAGLSKWGNSFLYRFKNIKFIDELLNTDNLDTVASFLIFISVFIIAFSLIGLCGIKSLNKTFLITYELIVLLLLITHTILILVLIFTAPNFDKDYKIGLNLTVSNINNQINLENNCELMKGISELFECCGVNGPNDFINKTIPSLCCASYSNNSRRLTKIYEKGCIDVSVTKAINEDVHYMIVPSAIILMIELFVAVMIPYFIGRISDYSSF